ncbi:MAG: LLM class oxidoreductase [Pseudomonadota bacterium]|nr:LLM class oxidoreductase [Pseudomonadota bacterium]MEC8294539.1 LLM class oxidoreductase [Pseudomonadota bacterium]
MPDGAPLSPFPQLDRGYATTFQPNRLSLGLVVPLEAYPNSAVPTMEHHIERAQLADKLGFSALWLRDVPFNVPSFGDAGQIYDPFVYLGLMSGVTRNIALGVASAILPLRHPAHVAKAAYSADQLSGGRVLLGVASGDRPDEYPALNMSFPDRGERFREAFDYIRALGQTNPIHQGAHGSLNGQLDMLPKPTATRLPLLITGGSQQSPDWVAEHGDGWITYPRSAAQQAQLVADYRARAQRAGAPNKPVMQSLYVDLLAEDSAAPSPIHLGFRSGVSYLKSYLTELQAQGVNHVALNLRFNRRNIDDTMNQLADGLLPNFGRSGD